MAITGISIDIFIHNLVSKCCKITYLVLSVNIYQFFRKVEEERYTTCAVKYNSKGILETTENGCNFGKDYFWQL